MAGAAAAVRDLGPCAALALDLQNLLARAMAWEKGTYNTSAVTAAEVPVAVGSIASAVGAALVTAVSGTAGVAGLEDRAGRDGGGEEGSEEDGELHFD